MTYERVVGLNVTDESEYQRYRDAMEPILNSMGGAFGYDFKIAEVLRSKTDDKINRVFTIEFPSKQVMEAFFSRADYLEIQNQHLLHSTDSKTIISLHEKDA